MEQPFIISRLDAIRLRQRIHAERKTGHGASNWVEPWWMAEVERLLDSAANLREQLDNGPQVAALEFYADPATWSQFEDRSGLFPTVTTLAAQDQGARAREGLGIPKEETANGEA